MKMNSRCGNCGASIPNRGKFHRCSCGSEFSRAKLSDTWKVSRLPPPEADEEEPAAKYRRELAAGNGEVRVF